MYCMLEKHKTRGIELFFKQEDGKISSNLSNHLTRGAKYMTPVSWQVYHRSSWYFVLILELGSKSADSSFEVTIDMEYTILDAQE